MRSLRTNNVTNNREATELSLFSGKYQTSIFKWRSNMWILGTNITQRPGHSFHHPNAIGMCTKYCCKKPAYPWKSLSLSPNFPLDYEPRPGFCPTLSTKYIPTCPYWLSFVFFQKYHSFKTNTIFLLGCENLWLAFSTSRKTRMTRYAPKQVMMLLSYQSDAAGPLCPEAIPRPKIARPGPLTNSSGVLAVHDG